VNIGEMFKNTTGKKSGNTISDEEWEQKWKEFWEKYKKENEKRYLEDLG
jgi:hypothetical protein